MSINKRERLDQLEKTILEKNSCPKLRAQATQLVMGSGNLDADIVLIGEAPGKKEDETGMPFVGASGKFLDQMLEAAGMKREDVYITNIVKYRPPNNRDPLAEEKQAFWPYLLRQLEIISPKAIVTLGRHSGAYFIPNLVISRDHGVPHTYSTDAGTFVVIPLYHPAAALYNGGMRQILINDLIKVSHILNKK